MRRRLLTRGLTALGGSALAIAAGLIALINLVGGPLMRVSYDVPFIWRGEIDTDKVMIVYLDDDSAKKLNQPLGVAWNRELHTRLLDRLTQDGARLVMFDIAFDASTADAAGDAALADAIRRNGRVILGALIEKLQTLEPVAQERVLAPIPALRKAALGWGLLVFRPIDPDYGVRRMFLGNEDFPSSTWRAAEKLGANLAPADRLKGPARWVNYYGPPGQFSSVSLVQALQPEGLPAGYFKDRIVLVGAKAAAGFVGDNRDVFVTAYSRQSGEMSTGVEIHATILLNLLRGEWLTRLAPKWEFTLVIGVGLLLGLLALLRPLSATFVALAVALTLACVVWVVVWNQHIWFSWLVPVAIQVPVGLFWSLGSQYYLEARRRKELRKAFGFYLSPDMADKISNSDFDLTPGGHLVDATIVFTDLEGFTTIAEGLGPDEVSKTLIEYFERTTKCILERKGTIVKYVGDAVMAGWGAPIAQADHAILAAEAACDLRCMTEMEVRGKKLRTRIGLHSGEVLAGNLGSSYRFDYTMIGDTTNFASRLEALNKYLRTQVLISEESRLRLGDRFITRRVGDFRVAGKQQSVSINELLCRCASENGERQWIEKFEQGLDAYRVGDFVAARRFFGETRDLRGGTDGPSDFYLNQIAKVEGNDLPEGWTGVVEMSEK